MTRRPALAAIALAGTLALGACGSVAPPSATPTAAPTAAPATPSPSPTPAPTPTPSPTATPLVPPTPTEAPSGQASHPASSLDPALGGFAFSPKDVLDYYVSQGFQCEDPYPSNQAAGYTVQRCLVEKEDGLISLIALAINDKTQATGDAFAAVLRRPGQAMPTAAEAIEHLGGFTTAMLGADETGIGAATWVGQHAGEAQISTQVGDMLLGTYTTDDASGVGIYVEVANRAFRDAPKP